MSTRGVVWPTRRSVIGLGQGNLLGASAVDGPVRRVAVDRKPRVLESGFGHEMSSLPRSCCAWFRIISFLEIFAQLHAMRHKQYEDAPDCWALLKRPWVLFVPLSTGFDYYSDFILSDQAHF